MVHIFCEMWVQICVCVCQRQHGTLPTIPPTHHEHVRIQLLLVVRGRCRSDEIKGVKHALNQALISRIKFFARARCRLQLEALHVLDKALERGVAREAAKSP